MSDPTWRESRMSNQSSNSGSLPGDVPCKSPEGRLCGRDGCTRSLEGLRSNARYCSSRCRAMASRAGPDRTEPPPGRISAKLSGALAPWEEQSMPSSESLIDSFIPIHIHREDKAHESHAARTDDSSFELLFSSKFVLKLPSLFNQQTLRRLLQLLLKGS